MFGVDQAHLYTSTNTIPTSNGGTQKEEGRERDMEKERERDRERENIL